jgi:hypothetical protein
VEAAAPIFPGLDRPQPPSIPGGRRRSQRGWPKSIDRARGEIASGWTARLSARRRPTPARRQRTSIQVRNRNCTGLEPAAGTPEPHVLAFQLTAPRRYDPRELRSCRHGQTVLRLRRGEVTGRRKRYRARMKLATITRRFASGHGDTGPASERRRSRSLETLTEKSIRSWRCLQREASRRIRSSSSLLRVPRAEAGEERVLIESKSISPLESRPLHPWSVILYRCTGMNLLPYFGQVLSLQATGGLTKAVISH